MTSDRRLTARTRPGQVIKSSYQADNYHNYHNYPAVMDKVRGHCGGYQAVGQVQGHGWIYLVQIVTCTCNINLELVL